MNRLRDDQDGQARLRQRGRTRPADMWPTVPSKANLHTWAHIATVGIFYILVIAALDLSAYFIIPVAMAIMVGMTFGPTVDWLERRGIPPRLGGLIVLLGIVGVVYALFLIFSAPIEEWLARVPEAVRKMRLAVFWIQDPLEKIKDIGEQVKDVTAGSDDGKLKVEVSEGDVVTTALTSTPALLGQVLMFVGTFYFFVVGRKPIKTALLALASSYPWRLRIARALRDMERSLSRYVLVITAINISLGIATGTAMWALGLPSPALWGALAALLNYIQFIGPAVMAIILAGVSLITFDLPAEAILPPLIFLALNLLEGQFFTPAILGSRFVINPLLVFLSLAFWLWLWGPIGAFLAMPILIILAIAMYHALPPGRREAFSLGISQRRLGPKQVRE